MSNIKQNDNFKKIVSVVLVYTVFFQQITPYAGVVVNSEKGSLFMYHRSNEIIDTKTEDNETWINKKSIQDVEAHLETIETETVSMAPKLSGGPGQKESSGFSIGSSDGLVDKFTGDFTYSIPLMDVEGYPIMLNYNSNIGMNQEASWVGLGWDLNVGSISREMRGLPDEFNGDQQITKTVNQKANTITDGWKVGTRVSFGIPVGNLNLGVGGTVMGGGYNNSYVGNGKTFDFSTNLALTKSLGSDFFLTSMFSLGFNIDTKNGVGRNVQFGLSTGHKTPNGGKTGLGPTYGRTFNSRYGLTSQSIGLGADGDYQTILPKMGGGFGISTSSQLTYGSLTMTPSARYNGIGNSDYFSGEAFVQAGGFKISGLLDVYSSESKVDFGDYNIVQQINQPAYGYLHSGKRARDYSDDNKYPIMDFNRTNDYEYSESMKNLAFSFQTYDIFRTNAYGISATFRARRTDIGSYKDPLVKSVIEGDLDAVNVGVIPAASQLQVGYANGNTDADSRSGNWNNVLEFITEPAGDEFDRSVYFKAIGEMTPEDLDALSTLGGNTSGYFDINKVNNEIVLTDYLKIGNGGSNVSGSTINQLTDEVYAATIFNPITSVSSTDPSFESYSLGIFINGTPPVVINRNEAYREDNHISEVEVISTNGMQYIYGIPTYNVSSNEVSFSVEGNTFDLGTNLVRYSPGDNSIANNKGRANSYEKTQTPAYAHSFLLTEMRSSDYVDVDDNGLSVDDIGSYYKFNYTQLYGDKSASGNYKWRFPISDNGGNQAMYNRGLEGTELDNMAYYSYGEKEIWYTHSVEGKNLIAEFYLEDREDAYGVLNEDGQLDSNKPLKRLKKIVLFNKSERQDPVNGANAIPLQTVEFIYDYSLCRNNPANKNTNLTPDYNESGKLTLREIRVYSGNSAESGLAAYKFEYSTENPDFNYGCLDAWGNYKPNNDTDKPNHIFPYADQNELNANTNVQAWKITGIINPMGGKTEITYEADRYVSVQNKRTMRHFDVHKMTNLIEFLHIQNQSNWNGVDNSYLEFRKNFNNYQGIKDFFDNNGYGGLFTFDNFYNAAFTHFGFAAYAEEFGKFKPKFVPNNVIIFKLQDDISGSLSKSDAGMKVKSDYFATGLAANDYLKQLYFKTHVHVKNDGEDVYELVPTFAEISKDYVNPFYDLLPFEDDFKAIGVMPKGATGDYEYGYVIVDPVNSGNRERKNDEGDDKNGVLLHPIQRAALDFVRQNLPDKVYGSCDGCDPNLSVDVVSFFGGDMYKYMIDEGGYVDRIETDHSTVRLHIPGNVKYGGNARVATIKYIDNWDAISGEYPSTYEWHYKYPSRQEESGVASYEPRAANDENPFYYWDTYVNMKKKFPDERNFTPTPMQDALFPIPLVGYSEVIVDFNGLGGYGYSKAQFHTSAEAPYVTRYSNTEMEPTKDRQWQLIQTSEFYGFTQGYVVETNDFHGKPAKFSIYRNVNGQDVIQSETEFIYKDLGSPIQMIDRNGLVNSYNVGMEYDIHEDSRFSYNNSIGITVGLNLKFTLPLFIPFFPTPIFSYAKREQGFYTNTLVKHINRSAIIESIRTSYLGSDNTAKNILYDKYTGGVILSALTDEYDDELFSLSYPSHWYEAELRDYWTSHDAKLNLNITGSVLDITGLSENVFSPGDELEIDNGTITSNAFILSIDGNSITLINPNGSMYNGTSGAVEVTMIQTARNNRLSEKMQSVVTKKEITPVSGSTLNFPTEEIISSSALNYRNKSNIRCRYIDGEPEENNEVMYGSVVNPFKYGMMGDIVLDGQFTWQGNRTHENTNHGTRFDGVYAVPFVPYYKIDANGNWQSILDVGHDNYDGSLREWRKMGEITRYDEFGKPLESVDQIDVFSSVLYGYNKELSFLPVAQAVNARQQEIAYDGFEDYSFYSIENLNYEETHFDFINALGAQVRINNEVRHSGLSSLEIDPGGIAQVQKGVSGTCLAPGDGVIPNDGNTNEITARNCLCVVPFEPTEGDYIIGAWVKVGNEASLFEYSDALIEVEVIGGLTYQFSSSGPILDGWQRLEGEFNIPATASGLIVRLKNNSASDQVYLDDLRIHPFVAGMTTTVYDPKTMLPLATHDGYNFTTYYNYDENLRLVRIRVETIEGIKTLSESEFGGQKSFNN